MLLLLLLLLLLLVLLLVVVVVVLLLLLLLLVVVVVSVVVVLLLLLLLLLLLVVVVVAAVVVVLLLLLLLHGHTSRYGTLLSPTCIPYVRGFCSLWNLKTPHLQVPWLLEGSNISRQEVVRGCNRGWLGVLGMVQGFRVYRSLELEGPLGLWFKVHGLRAGGFRA